MPKLRRQPPLCHFTWGELSHSSRIPSLARIALTRSSSWQPWERHQPDYWEAQFASVSSDMEDHISSLDLQTKDDAREDHPYQGDDRDRFRETTQEPWTGNEDFVTTEDSTCNRDAISHI